MEALSKEVTAFSLDDAEYERLKAIIQAAKAEKKVEVFRKPTRASGVLEKDVRAFLQAAEESMECSEWLDAGRIYYQLHEMNLGPKSIASKLSICLLLSSEYLPAFPLAKQAIIDTPLDSYAYITMAIIKGHVGQLSESEKFLQLAELGVNPDGLLISETRRENTIYAQMQKSEIASFRYTMKTNPDFIESYKITGDHHDVDNMDAVLASMARVKENPDCLQEEITANLQFGALVTWNNFMPEINFPRRFDDELSRQFAQVECPLHSINYSVFWNIFKFLSYRDLVSLKNTCRFLEYLGSFPQIYEELVLREGFGPLPPQHWMAKSDINDYRAAFAMLQNARAFLNLYQKLSKEVNFESQKSREYYSDQLRQFSISRNLFGGEAYSSSARLLWSIIAGGATNWKENNLAKKLVLDVKVWEALQFGLACPTPTYYDDFPVLVTTFVNLVVLGKFEGPIPASIVNRFSSLLESVVHTDASAALAVCYNSRRLAEMNFISVHDSVESIQTIMPAHRSKYFAIDGIWQGVQGYTHPAITERISEECIMNLKFPTVVVGENLESVRNLKPFEMIGAGIDSFGEFELEDAMIDAASFSICFTKVYRQTDKSQSPIKHFYSGILYPSGIGGHFGRPPTENELVQIGFFFYGRPMACADASIAYSPTFASVSHTPTVCWEDLLPQIAERAAKNAKARAALLERFHLDPNNKSPIYELPLSDLACKLDMRSANRASFLAIIPSTSLAEMRAYLAENQGIEHDTAEITQERYLKDSDMKWSLRRQMIRATLSRIDVAYFNLLVVNLDSLDQIDATLKRFNFDPQNPEVLNALERFTLISQYTTHSRQLDPRTVSRVIGIAKADFERYKQEEMAKAEASTSDVVPESVSNLLSDTVRRRGGEAGRSNKDGSKRQSGVSPTLIASAVAASALVLVGAFFVGRLFSKRKSEN